MKKCIWALCLGILLCWGKNLQAQHVLEQKVSIRVENVLLEEALFQLMDRHAVQLSFTLEILPKKTITLSLKNEQLQTVLEQLLKNTGISYRLIENQIVLYKLPPPERKFTISGFVQDKESGEKLVAATIIEKKSGKGVETNEYGFFSITLPAGEATLTALYLGYEAQEYTFNLNSNQRLAISLQSSLTLPLIEVIARDSITKGLKSGISTDFISLKDIKQLPTLGGEPDIIRLTHLMPGIQTGTDGIGGIHVRGGNSEHNLVLIDGVPVYNISHAAGLFSIFNTSAIRSAQLLKSGFPARYGGRLASVLDIQTKEGNLHKFNGELEGGLLTGRILLEGPIIREKSSFLVSARHSFLNWYIQPFSRKQKLDKGQQGETSYRFYDINAKFHYIFSEKDKIYLSLYHGDDSFSNDGFRADSIAVYSTYREDTLWYRYDQAYEETFNWGNTVAAFRWNHVFGHKLFANTTLTYSKLSTGILFGRVDSLVLLNNLQTIGKALDFGSYRSSIEDVGAKVDFDWLLSSAHTIQFGAGLTRHQFNPGALNYDESFSDFNTGGTQSNDPIASLEYSAYLEDNITIGNALSFNIGLHAAQLWVQDEQYNSLQPRLSLYWLANKNLGIRASYGKMVQFLHLLSNSSIGLPTDLWVPATANVKPQSAWQTSLGFDFSTKKVDFGVEAYYKKMENLLNYSEGALFLNDWEENVTSGEGEAYGIEFLMKKNIGKTTGWVAYTLSWSNRQFDLVNLGNSFPFRFDRRHDLKIVFQHAIFDWWRISANWILSSGFAYSLPQEEFIYPSSSGGAPVINFGAKNSFRMPYYHRFDLNMNFSFKSYRLLHTFNVGVYNIYNRANPLYYDIRTTFINDNDVLKEVREYVQVTLLPILPSVNYSIRF